jgi:hypothetical protein
MQTKSCCDICGIPLDSEYFDVSGFLENDKLPRKGERAIMSSFQIHPQYCGVLECFAQFTDLYARDNTKVETPGLQWMIMRNGQPLFPYHQIESIVNPWGFNNFQFLIRLDESSRIEFVLYNRNYDNFPQTNKNTNNAEDIVSKVGGRLIGRFWYNDIYGNLPGKNKR